MYRAQVGGRCSLQFAGRDSNDLERWREEWIDSSSEKPRYQKALLKTGLDDQTYRILVKFPFRLLSNCGQDSVIRPIMGKNGIPLISGSSVKGLFRRGCDKEQARKYCGFEDVKDKGHCPSTSGLRFHGAYPVGDWSGSHRVKGRDNVTKVRYRMLDVVHPQQPRQIGTGEKQNATALTSISLYKPTMIFEFSGNALTEVDWKEVENIFWKAIAFGIGGKTSTGYGLGGYNDIHPAVAPSSKTNVALIGQGVSPTLRSDEPEFRPNLFKASLRGHVKRLLGGVTKDVGIIDKEVERLFGSSSDVGVLKIFWDQQKDVVYGDFGQTKTFKTEGILYLDGDSQQDINFIEQVLKFAFVMGGFGKSWRRASHQLFHKSYKKFEIGCHWQLASTDLKWLDIKSEQDLKRFLEDLHNLVEQRLAANAVGYQTWREAWHPERVTVYAKQTQNSNVIDLFHNNIFKKTEAIGGHVTVRKFNHKKQKEEDVEQLEFSHVWHRMLPIGDGNYLEIVTVFHHDRDKWKHKRYKNDNDGEDQLKPFLEAIAERGLKYVWGNQKPLEPSSSVPKSLNVNPKSLPTKSSDKPKLKPKN
jgi:CRISPR-associated protein Cmr6